MWQYTTISCCIILFILLSIPVPSSSLHLCPVLMSIEVTELILNYLFALYPEISYKEQTLLSQPINKGTSASELFLPLSAK